MLAFVSPRGAPLIARTGVAVFGLSLFLPTFVSGVVARSSAPLVVATTAEVGAATAYELPPLADPLARPRATPQSPPQPGGGSVVMASWYGPGFYENRLPCWQWLAANGLPVQFLPDTWGVAHKSLPCGTLVTLTHGTTTVTVPVVDRGPYVPGREVDLSPRVKAALGCTDLCTVVMQIR